MKAGKVGMKLSAGEQVLTKTGRLTTPFPKVDVSTDRKAHNTVKRVDQWLMQNAYDEAVARNDEYNSLMFRVKGFISPADKDCAEQYLFS